MKQFWIGCALLLALLAAGIGTERAMRDLHDPIANDLEQASRAALGEDWQQALTLSARAQQAWESGWHFTATVVDHTPMEDIDSLFAELQVYAQRRETVHFAACCAELSRQTRAVGEAHSINWWNIM